MKTLTSKTVVTVVVFTAIALFFQSCSDNEQGTAPDTNKSGEIVLKFDNWVGNEDLILGKQYNKVLGEQFTPDMLKYFVSNLKLYKDGETTPYVVPQDSSYFLIDEENIQSQEITIRVPEGNYSKVTFILGVDSLRNTMDVSKRTGVLDVGGKAKDMYWSWNSGYIFLKMEGTSPQITATNKFRYHIGLFGGYSTPTLNNIKEITIDFGVNRASVRAGKTPEVHIIADILKIFSGTTDISLANNHTVMVTPFSASVAANYANMFEFDHIHD